MADCSHTYCWSYANCQFGVRTQAERADDDHVWRETAESRPGYATWPDTAPGSPSWWLRHAVGVQTVDGRLYAPQDVTLVFPDPPPVDGETCKQWCGYCHLAPDPEPARAAMDTAFPRPHTAEWLARAAADDGPATPDDPAELRARIKPPRRRWLHRYTRRTR